MLFTELSKRSNNPVYNLLGDIIAQLSTTAGVVSGLRNIDQTADTAALDMDSASAPETETVSETATVAGTSTATATTNQQQATATAELRVLTNAEFQETMAFLLKFVNKDKQGDSLLERLLCRFATSISTRQNRHLSYCISQLPITEKGVKKMIDLFKYVALFVLIVFSSSSSLLLLLFLLFTQ